VIYHNPRAGEISISRGKKKKKKEVGDFIPNALGGF
jgi:hypothetical protein